MKVLVLQTSLADAASPTRAMTSSYAAEVAADSPDADIVEHHLARADAADTIAALAA